MGTLFRHYDFNGHTRLIRRGGLQQGHTRYRLRDPFLESTKRRVRQQRLLKVAQQGSLTTLIRRTNSPLRPNRFSYSLAGRHHLTTIQLTSRGRPGGVLFRLRRGFIQRLCQGHPYGTRIRPLRLLRGHLTITVRVTSYRARPTTKKYNRGSVHGLHLIHVCHTTTRNIGSLFSLGLVRCALPRLRQTLQRILRQRLPAQRYGGGAATYPRPGFVSLHYHLY